MDGRAEGRTRQSKTASCQSPTQQWLASRATNIGVWSQTRRRHYQNSGRTETGRRHMRTSYMSMRHFRRFARNAWPILQIKRRSPITSCPDQRFVWRSLSRANIPSTKEPKGLITSDERRPDGLTLVPWNKGKCLAWDATVADTFAPTYLSATSVKAGTGAELLANKKLEKYQDLEQRYIFCPVAVETMGPIDEESSKLLSAIDRHITEHTGEPRESQFLYQRLSIIIQRGNAASFKGSDLPALFLLT